MGLRSLILLLIVGLLLWLIRSLIRERRERKRPAAEDKGQQKILPCAHCGLHVPEDEAILFEGRSYCSEAHRLKGARH